MKNQEKEIWLPIINYNGLYEISSFERVRGLDRRVVRKNKGFLKIKGRILRPAISSSGYLSVSLSKNSRGLTHNIHRLMAEHFIDNPNNYKCVNHLDGNKLNNNIPNLEWCTYSQNSIHAHNSGLMDNKAKGSKSYLSKLNEDDVKNIKKMIRKGLSNKKIKTFYDIDVSTISSIKIGRTWSHVNL